MSIKLESSTDSQEAVTAALGDAAPDDKPEDKSAEAQEASETADESETSEDHKEVESKEGADEESEESEDDDKEVEKLEAKPKKQSGFKRRIDKLNSKLSAKDAEIEHWKNEALKRNQNQEAEKPVAAAKSEVDGKPQADKFETHEEYVEALADWKVEQKLLAHEQKVKESQVKTEFQRQVDAHMERVKAFAEAMPDYHDVMEDVADVRVSLAVEDLILSSENGPEIMYAFAKNPDELERINKLPPLAAAREFGKFEAGLKSEKKPAREIKKTKAPAPLKTVGNKPTGSGKKSIYDTNLSQREYERLREEQSAKNG